MVANICLPSTYRSIFTLLDTLILIVGSIHPSTMHRKQHLMDWRLNFI